MNKIKGTVVGEFNTRFIQEKEWNETLIQLEKGTDISDSDVTPYYSKAEDGKYYEYYGKEVTNEFPIYRRAYEEELPRKRILEQILAWIKKTPEAKNQLESNINSTYKNLVSLGDEIKKPTKRIPKHDTIQSALEKLENAAETHKGAFLSENESKAILTHITIILKESN